MLEEEEDFNLSSSEMGQKTIDEGDRTGKEFEEQTTDALTSASMTAAADSSDGHPNTDQQSPKHRRGRPKKNHDIKNQPFMRGEFSIVNVSLTNSPQRQHTDSERTLANKSSSEQPLKGTADQDQKHRNTFSSSFTSANEQPVTSQSREIAVIIQNNCSPVSDMIHHVPVSDTERQYELSLEEQMNNDGHSEGEEQGTAQSLSSMTDLTCKEMVKCKNSPALYHYTVAFNKSSTTLDKGDKKDKQDTQIAELTQLGNSVCVFSTDAKSTELTDQEELKLDTLQEVPNVENTGGCSLPDELKCLDPNFTIQKSAYEKTFQPVEEVVKEQMNRGMSPESEVKHRRKVGRPPKRKRIVKTQVLKKVNQPLHLDSVQCFHGNSDIETFDKSKMNVKPLEIIEKEAALKPKPTGLSNFDACQIQTYKTSVKNEDSQQIISMNIKPQRKVGRPRKKCITGVVEHNGCNALVKESINFSPQTLLGRNILGKVGICSEEQNKSNKEQQTRKPPLEVSSQEPSVRRVSEKNAVHKEKINALMTNPNEIQEVIGKEKKASTEGLQGLKDTDELNPNGPLFQKPTQCSHQKNTLTEMKKGKKVVQECLPSPQNVFEPQTQSASEQGTKIVHVDKSKQFSDQGRQSKDMKIQDLTDNLEIPQQCLMLSQSTDLIQETRGNIKEGVKKVNTACEELGKAGKILTGFKASSEAVKFKRKIGRPLKKKTLIKMARQLVMAQEGRVNKINLIGHPDTPNSSQNITLHHSKKNKGKKEKKKASWLTSLPETHLRRYTRACKVVTDYTIEKHESHLGHRTNKPILTPDPLLFPGRTTKPSNLRKIVTPETKTEQLAERKFLGRKRKHPKIDIKIEETYHPGLSDFSLENPVALQQSLSKTIVSNSVLSTGKNALNIWNKQRKARKIKPVMVQMENVLPHSTDSYGNMNRCLSVPENILTPEHEPKCIPCSPNVTSDMIERTHNTVNMKGQGETEMSQTSHFSVNSMPELQVDTSNKYLLSSQDAAKTVNVSPVKVPRKRGRPRKNLIILDQESEKEVKTQTDTNSSVADRSPSLSKVSCSKSPEMGVSYLDLSTKLSPKKPHKVDRRRKRFRNQKALPGLESTLDKLFETVTQTTDTEIEGVPQKHSKGLNVESVLQNARETKTWQLCQVDTNLVSMVQQHIKFNSAHEFRKQRRKGVGSRKRRKRKRSWWDDRGKTKCEPLETNFELMVKTDEDKTVIEKMKESVTVEKISSKPLDEFANMNHPEFHAATDSITQTRFVTEEPKTDGEILAVVQSDARTNINAQQETDSGNILHEKQDNFNIHKMFTKNQVSIEIDKGNQIQVSCSGNDVGKSLEVMTPESYKKTMDKLTAEITQGKTSLDSHSETEAIDIMDSKTVQCEEIGASEVTIPEPGEISENTRKEDEQIPIHAIEQREGGALTLTSIKTFKGNDSDILHLVSTESTIQIPFDSKSLETVNEKNTSHEHILSNLSDEKAARKDLSSHTLFSNLFQNQNTAEENLNQLKQSDQYLDEDKRSTTIPEDNVAEKILEEASPTSNPTKPRGPGRPPKYQGRKPIECHYCGRSFHYISSYIIHRRIHTGERPYNCQECGKTFAQRSNLNTHRKIHNMSESLQCPYCDSRFTDRDKLLEHCKTHTKGSDKADFIEKLGQEGICIETQHKSNSASSTITLKDAKPHVCEFCGKRFCFISMLKIHLRVHSREKPYTCKVCGKAFSQAYSLYAHEKIHWSVKPYVCTMCGKGFTQLGTLKTHLCQHKRENHVKKVKTPITFQCHICEKRFGLRHQYNLHMRTHTDVQSCTCLVCGQKVSDLNVHRQSCIKLGGEHALAEDGGTISPVCQVSEKSQYRYSQHFQSQPLQHSEVKNNQYHQPQPLQPQYEDYQKTRADISYPQVQNYKPFHMKKGSHSSQTYPIVIDSSTRQTEISNLEYLQQYSLSRYCCFQLQHCDHKTNPRKYLCPRCGRLFRHLGRLRAHMLTHIRGQTYTCGHCGRVLENWNKFWLHQRVHRQQQGRFFCSTCGQGFRFTGLYKQHLEEHTKQQAIGCPLSPYTISHEESLKTHQREWHNSYKPCRCSICGKGFLHQRNLERHLLIKHSTRSCSCSLCSISFSYPNELQIHLKTHATPNNHVPAVSSQSILLPYRCAECKTSFRTLNLLFSHQLCHSSSSKTKAWHTGKIVGQQHQKQLSYRCKHTMAPFVRPEISSLSSLHTRRRNFYSCKDRISVPITNHISSTICQQDSSNVSHSIPPVHLLSQEGGSKIGNPSNIQPLVDDTCLTQTVPASIVVPFSETQTEHFNFHTQTSTSIPPSTLQQISQAQRDSQKKQIPYAPKPLHTYEMSTRIIRRVLSSSFDENEEDDEDSFDCAECGAQFGDVPGLYEHYLQHARGEV
ncbi:uncharacterized protein si:dkeyp-84f3.9 [Brienomyrus brachyistius]|uniref:uncharacterized protein si:dkeyp-84f3.9 n=1 Tax=Brienomyrus brachyistius TaxID=42636 RepID=UPI0020B3370E|nr:uncharacterized protein si:dkeyp-84f3.9 [Brienomyrus brachyistius]XP_048880199.1 uncharacterized protein si:dkeyp-84f3.9 [Brienomyrus brachyistius]XP_048880200.1 uncharacterized protein si:dkeyp-84f3.9 [Brienomyrus brachyistius]